MKKFWTIILVIAILGISTVTVFADAGEPAGGCPDNFRLHQVMAHDHMDMGDHLHIGNDQDNNGDGWICGKHVGVSGNNHVHIDNNIPLP